MKCLTLVIFVCLGLTVATAQLFGQQSQQSSQVYRSSQASAQTAPQNPIGHHTYTYSNTTKIDFNDLTNQLDRAKERGQAGYERFLELLREQRAQLEKQYQELEDAATSSVRGSLERADAWKETARKEAEESLHRLEEFKRRAEAKNVEFVRAKYQDVTDGKPLTCDQMYDATIAAKHGITDTDRRIICEAERQEAEMNFGLVAMANCIFVLIGSLGVTRLF